ncbi:hypothetical protein PAAG_06929 [Paracoccidioides lutzii Pb01]|uniref:Uncharacterized protein n=1 Tax=Paracoccidioides lutzii (strain ATCC MYA-826 / Pb01) TaxID=502779 RepID=C1H8D3_PARBA|nr:hypothetical protein PAAG_06929 [Paracoccidioides lutzii Pb01]EEH36511.2 hypothetical protein PAAG_06929 [Paracoccidioides lutzii Pb01]
MAASPSQASFLADVHASRNHTHRQMRGVSVVNQSVPFRKWSLRHPHIHMIIAQQHPGDEIGQQYRYEKEKRLT